MSILCLLYPKLKTLSITRIWDNEGGFVLFCVTVCGDLTLLLRRGVRGGGVLKLGLCPTLYKLQDAYSDSEEVICQRCSNNLNII